MGRSQESFGKKEREKKKVKKKKDKLSKKEDRKTNSDKGKSLEDMFAYVDEFGNLSSTPPDPNKKKSVVNLEDIQIGVAKQEPIDPADLLRKGTITFFNDSKGFGFIKDHISQESVFVHINNLVDRVAEGDKVSFETEKGPKGLSAIKVRLIS
ncbi:MAG TPA: DNA-binding protein [Aquificaceae bacterium]|jgi:cold shock CspA family protein|nr:DNA-binding protein [Aquificaceae bacterium]